MVVLYADDDIDDYTIFRETAAALIPGIQFINAEHGRQVLDTLERLSGYPDLIVLDINMPTMDGKVCLKELKSDRRFEHIPVVMYTTGADSRDINECLQLGAAEYVIKPNSVTELENILNKVIRPLLGNGKPH